MKSNALFQEFYEEIYTLDLFDGAELSEKIGHISFSFNGNRAQIMDIYVESFYRRKGYGSQLLEEVEIIMKEKEVTEIHVNIYLDNIKDISHNQIQHFFSRNGYRYNSQFFTGKRVIKSDEMFKLLL